MGNRITALAPVRRPSQGGSLTRPKPAGALLFENLINAIEGLKDELAVRSERQPPVRYVPSQPVEYAPPPVEVRQIQSSKPTTQKVTVKRSGLLDFFD